MKGSRILAVETSTSLCSLCLWEEQRPIAYEEVSTSTSQASVLFELLERIQSQTNVDLRMLSHVAVTRGPGSFTGLRVGLSFAKGISLSASIPLLGLSCFEVAMHKVKTLGMTMGVVCFCLDTKREDFYTAFYEGDRCLEIGVFNTESLLEKARQLNVQFFFTDKYWSIEEGACFQNSLRLTAADVARAAQDFLHYAPSLFSVDPLYLRPPKVYEGRQ